MGSPITKSGCESTSGRAESVSACAEDDEFSEEIRQMVVGRYRILFKIKGRKVHVLHVRGAYLGD